MKIYLNDGKVIEGKTYKQLIKILRAISFDESATKSQYIVNIQNRVMMLYQEKIRTKDYRDFLVDLQSLGLIRLEE